jgi:HAD superfamily phosphoserine phosphatase-like hydrolase
MTKWAVFDVDGTLFPPTSMEKKYLLYLLSHGILPLRNILYYAFYVLYTLLRRDWVEAFKNNKYYLKEIPATAIRKNGAHFVNRHLNYKILIMSGSPDFLTEILSTRLKPDYVITARMQTSNGVFTGKLNGLHPYGERKTRLLLAVSSKIALNFKKSIVFANHSSDIDHMKLFGTAVAVNPKPGLREFALKNNWSIEQW